jgi:hypothetical protein
MGAHQGELEANVKAMHMLTTLLSQAGPTLKKRQWTQLECSGSIGERSMWKVLLFIVDSVVPIVFYCIVFILFIDSTI